ncbi:MAG TPA: HlyD family secretion protein [Polyangiaceae bacterium]|jgi:membrane fusion protein (multidrug efflux system)
MSASVTLEPEETLTAPPATTAGAPAEAQAARGLSRRNVALAILLAAATAGGSVWYAQTRGRESTDDAQIDADVVSVPARTAGTVTHVAFVENQTVHAGDVLATLDDGPLQAQLEQAQAAYASAVASADAADADERAAETNAVGSKAAADATLRATRAGASSVGNQIAEADAALASALATRDQARQDRDRDARLFESGAVTRVAVDQRETALALAEANVKAAQAHVVTLKSGVAQAAGQVAEAQARATQSSDVDVVIAQAKARAAAAHAQVGTAKAAMDLAALNLSYTRVVAPHDGVVSKKSVQEGQTVALGQPIVQLVTPGVWVTANFKETQLEKMRLGQPVTFTVDAYPSVKLHGTVESFSGGTGSRFTLLPPDNASGNFTKVVQRLPVRIHVDAPPAAVDLRPGLSVDATVDTRG